MANPNPFRVRFAPSPTGPLHVGGLRTALYNYLLARKHEGSFVLRIEDTDRNRYVPGSIEILLDSLEWAGLGYDEGPKIDGPHASYFQSERLPLYRESADRLVTSGHAYPCFCTAERLTKMREEQTKKGMTAKYDRLCAALPSGKGAERIDRGEPHVIRLRIPDGETIRFHDLIRGDVEIGADILDDQVLMKTDGFPTYHLAVVTDDHEMEITHVIRGEDWLPSTPKHILLYRYLGWELPQFAHLPLLLGTDRAKLSKRQADVAVTDYRDQGYFPEALINFVAFLGWNPGDDREVFTLDELVAEFSIDRVNKSGAIFNIEKLRWFNQQHMQRLPSQRLVAELRPILEERGFVDVDDDHLSRVIDLWRERVTFVHEIAERGAWFFVDPTDYEEATVKKRWTRESGALLGRFLPILQKAPVFDGTSLDTLITEFASREGIGKSELIHPLRLACTGVGGGPGLYELMEVLGKDTCIRRIRRAIEMIEGGRDQRVPLEDE
jgi:glutamyl-tRNA synthetase